MGNTSMKSSRINENIVHPLADTARSGAPSVVQPLGSEDMDDIDEYIRDDLRRLNCNRTVTSGFSRPSLPVLPSPEIIQQPDRDGDTAPRMVHFSEEGAFVAPDALMNRAYVGPSRLPCPSNEPYRVMVAEPVNRKSDVVAPMASTRRASVGTTGASRQASNKPHVKNEKQPQNRRSEVVVPLASTSKGCAGAGSESRQESSEPTVEIVEQPVPSRRFRYDSEILSAGAILGVQKAKGRKSFPKIKIANHAGPVEITVSLVCKDPPHRVHPNGIVGNKKTPEQKLKYIHVKQADVTRDNCVIEFDNLGIRFVKPDQIEEALRLREDQNIDPYGQGFSHEFDPKNDDLQAVRLCFHVKLALGHTLDPVVSDVIYHSRNVGCLKIDRVIQTCRCRVSSMDDLKVILKSEKLNPKDVEVVFYENENGEVWERCVREFEVADTRGIVCAVPHYPRASVDHDTVVKVALRRPSDGTLGDPMLFTYYADVDDINERKRKKANNLVQQFVNENWTPPTFLPPDNDSQNDQGWKKKLEPFDVNPPTPGPSSVYTTASVLNHDNSARPGPGYVNPSTPGPSSIYPVTVAGLNHANSAMPGASYSNPHTPEPSSIYSTVSGLNHANLAMPGASYVNPHTPGPSFVYPATMSGLNHDNSAMPGPSFINLDVPRRSHVNLAMPAPSSVTAGVLGSNPLESAAPGPSFVTSPVLGLNYLTLFSPEPVESMQTNLSMSPDMSMPSISQPMSVPKDKGFSSPNGHLDNDGEYPGADSATADVCYNLIDID